MKIAIVSDIHGNYDALSAFSEAYDQLWVLGDLVNYGPQPAEVIEFVRTRATLVVRGNHDHAVGFDEDPRCSPPFREMAEATRRYTASRLSDTDKHFLRGLPLQAETQVDRVKFHLCHAAPSDPLFQYCPPESPRWTQEVHRLTANILLVGHTHVPFTQRVGQCLVVNPGSLGQPKSGGPNACYAVWEDGLIELRSFPYPVEATITKIASLPIPSHLQERLAAVLRNGVP